MNNSNDVLGKIDFEEDQNEKDIARASSNFTTFTEIKDNPLTKKMLIEDFVGIGCKGMIYGASYELKTGIGLDMALSITTGKSWNGKETKQGIVFWYAGEAIDNIPLRVDAWCIHHGVSPDEIGDKFILSRKKLRFDSAISELIFDMNTMVACSDEYNMPVVAVFIDPLAQHLPLGADENNSHVILDFIDKVDALLVAFPGCTVFIIHHSGHDRWRPRGSTALPAAMDFTYWVNKGVLSCVKMKDGAEPEDIKFKCQGIDLGIIDERGNPVSSCVPVYGGVPARRQIVVTKLNGTEHLALTALHAACARLKSDNISPDEWRYDFCRLHPGENETSKIRVFNRALTAMITKKLVEVEGGFYSAKSQDNFTCPDSKINVGVGTSRDKK